MYGFNSSERGYTTMKKWLTAVLFGTLLVLGACGGGNGEGSSNNNGNSNDSAAGEEVYQENCASCHGDDLSGEAGPSLETVGADHSEDDIKDIIEEGQGSMPAGIVEGDDEDDVAAWLAEKD